MSKVVGIDLGTTNSLAAYVKDGVLQAPANGEFTYTLKGVHAKVSVTWA